MLCFISSSSNLWLTFQAKNNARSASAYTVALYLPKSRTEACPTSPFFPNYLAGTSVSSNFSTREAHKQSEIVYILCKVHLRAHNPWLAIVF